MDYLILLIVLSLTWALFIHVFIAKFLYRNSISLPPGPRAFPIIGNIIEMGVNPHHSLTNLSKTYGPSMTLRLGSITAIVISSPEFAKEALQKHDQALSSRTIVDAVRAHDHHKYSVLWLPASDQWRCLKKVTTTEFTHLREAGSKPTYSSKKSARDVSVRRGEFQDWSSY
ncbi:cytochrome P450 family 76 subfamily C polypeptide 3 [Euphorbia peplus]|nr:cytochrome P450 family 76 subfamily C polypeptide 3 [Euphorbia peplus]